MNFFFSITLSLQLFSGTFSNIHTMENRVNKNRRNSASTLRFFSIETSQELYRNRNIVAVQQNLNFGPVWYDPPTQFFRLIFIKFLFLRVARSLYNLIG
jgi:hypothetical protein